MWRVWKKAMEPVDVERFEELTLAEHDLLHRVVRAERDITLLLATVRSLEFVVEEILKDVRNHDVALARQRHALNEVFPAE